ncbi:MAG TPA: diguanylate cyclase [Chiayiivirga sp.]|nr:diguanylate cyclase [Chiayiivirga sp.]
MILSRLQDRHLSWAGAILLLLTVLGGLWFTGRMQAAGEAMETARVTALARTVAASLEAEQIIALHGDASDAGTPALMALREQLQGARSANPDFRFVYLMRPAATKPNLMAFLADAEPANSPDYSPPGELYTGVDDDLWRAWRLGVAVVQPTYADAWGRWVSTVAPVFDADGATVAVLGMDIRADAWQATLLRYRNFALTISALLLLLELLFLWGLYRQRSANRTLATLNSRMNQQLGELRAAQAGLSLADVVVQHTGEAIILLDSKLRVVRVNPAFSQITGYHVDAVLGQNLPLFKHEDQALLRRIRSQVDETCHWTGTLWAERANAEAFPLEGSINLVRDEAGNALHYVVVFRDVTVQKRLEDRLRELSVTDGLTGLPNRRAFDESLEREWQRCMRLREPISLVMIDIDHFKAYNDDYGHPAGDRALQQVAKALQSSMAMVEAALVTRYGGEEFAVILPRCPAPQATEHAETLRAAVAALGITHRHNLASKLVTISVGVSTHTPPDGIDLDALLLDADKALYRAKAHGRNGVETA